MNNEADRVISFIEKCCCIPSGNRRCGTKDGSPAVVLQWQRDFIYKVYGEKDASGLRKIREAFLGLPRKNGKSQFLAFLALYHLIASGKKNQDIYCFASSLNQARLLFLAATKTVRISPVLREIKSLHVYKNAIEFRSAGNTFQCKPATPNSLQGLNPSVALCDELHVWEDQELYNVITSAQNAQDEGLLISITTAGIHKDGIGWNLWEYSKKIISGEEVNPNFCAVLYGMEEGDDWKDEAVWAKCNPSMGHTFHIDELRTKFNKAKGMSSEAASFRRYYLNYWEADKAVQLIADEEWQLCEKKDLKMSDFTEMECFIGVDPSARNDITAVVAVFFHDYRWYVFPTFFLPSENLPQLEDKHKKKYSEWVHDGYLKTTTGDKINLQYISDYIIETFKDYNVKAISLDIKFQGQPISVALRDEGMPVFEDITGTFKHSETTKKLERLVKEKVLLHDGNPVMRWMVGNSFFEEGNRGDIRLCKRKNNNRYKIDGVTALVQALDYIKQEPRNNSITVDDIRDFYK